MAWRPKARRSSWASGPKGKSEAMDLGATLIVAQEPAFWKEIGTLAPRSGRFHCPLPIFCYPKPQKSALGSSSISQKVRSGLSLDEMTQLPMMHCKSGYASACVKT